MLALLLTDNELFFFLQPEVEVIKEYQEFNPFSELLFLEGHSDIVRLLLRIDANR